MAGHIAFAMISLVLGLTACATTPELASPGSRSFEGPVYRIKTPVEIATKPGFRQRCESRVETVRPDQSPRVTRRTWLSDVWPHPDGRRRVTRYLVDSERSATASV